jgi:UDP-3-O-acyl-N-acetylglucosamine deacetylase
MALRHGGLTDTQEQHTLLPILLKGKTVRHLNPIRALLARGHQLEPGPRLPIKTAGDASAGEIARVDPHLALPPLVTQYQSASFQATLRTAIHLRGRDGFTGEDAELSLAPAEPEDGLVFSCGGLSYGVRQLEPRYTQHRTTTLAGPNGWEVTTTEHLLSALHGLGITNVTITVGDNGRIPFLDGSAHEFCAAILDAGIQTQDQFLRRYLYCQRYQRLEGSSGSFIELRPPTTPTMKIRATIEFPPPIGVQTFEYRHSVASYCLQLGWARTFAAQEFDSLEQVQRRLPVFEFHESYGGAHVEAPMLVFEKGRYLVQLRRHDEPVRHKLADFIGDIAVAGDDLHADVELFRPGHKLNADLVRALRGAVEQTSAPCPPTRTIHDTPPNLSS